MCDPGLSCYPGPPHHHCCCSRPRQPVPALQQEVKLILRELRLLTRRLREKDEDGIVVSDWKFAAMLIDRWAAVRLSSVVNPARFCLYGLSLYTILTTVILFISAPHLIVK